VRAAADLVEGPLEALEHGCELLDGRLHEALDDQRDGGWLHEGAPGMNEIAMRAARRSARAPRSGATLTVSTALFSWTFITPQPSLDHGPVRFIQPAPTDGTLSPDRLRSATDGQGSMLCTAAVGAERYLVLLPQCY
jgi:hypothetical protein